MKNSLPDYTDLKYHSKRLYKILLDARSLADKSKWDDLEEYADSKLDEVISLSERAVATETGRMEKFGEDNRWEFFSTLIGSHEIDMRFGRLTFKMSLNLEGDLPVLMLN